MRATHIRKIDSTATNPPPARAFGSPMDVGIEYDVSTQGLILATANPPSTANSRVPFGGGRDTGVSTPLTGSPVLDYSQLSVYRITLGGNITPTFTGTSIGGDYALEVRQDATGSRLITWPANVKWPGGTAPTLTTTALRTDLFGFCWDGSNFLGYTLGLNYTST